jgi:hypothetical protein
MQLAHQASFIHNYNIHIIYVVIQEKFIVLVQLSITVINSQEN